MVPRSERGTAEPADLNAEPRQASTSEARDEFLAVPRIAELAGVSERAIRKAIQTGRLKAEALPSEDRRRQGQYDYQATLEDVFAAYPAARDRWHAHQAAAQAQAPKPTRDPREAVLRANPEALERAQAIQRARYRALEHARALLRALPESTRRRSKGGLPTQVLVALQQHILDTKDLLEELGPGAPSIPTLSRWWRLLVEDPSGESLKPQWSGRSGRPRKTDAIPDLEDRVLGAYSHSGSYAMAAEHLRRQGVNISEATVARVLGRQDAAVVKALRMGDRKAQTDLGPYVRRRASRPFQAWSLDGHTMDQLVLWDELMPGEVADPFRPTLYYVVDVGSGAVLAAILGKGLNRYLPMQALAAAILRTGMCPDRIQTDNGSEVVNALFQGDEDLEGYFAQLGAGWKGADALQTRALPYNSRSKPVERHLGTLARRFCAQFPAYVGGSPSTRPGAPLADALKAGNLETVASLKAHLDSYVRAEMERIHTIHGRSIHPYRALAEEKARLLAELGPDHPRFVHAGQEWRVLPSLKGRRVRGFVEARIEGQVLRFDAPSLHTLDVDGLQVRVNPWDVTQAWLCRGGELVEPLTFVPDGPELGAGETDLVALRIAANARRAQREVTKRAARETERIRQAEGYLTGRKALAPREVETIPAGAALSTEDRALARAQFEALGVAEAPAPVPTPLEPVLVQPTKGREAITDDISWARYCLAHPEDVDAEERARLNEFLRDNPALCAVLGVGA